MVSDKKNGSMVFVVNDDGILLHLIDLKLKVEATENLIFPDGDNVRAIIAQTQPGPFVLHQQ
jgi:hypothetical protein